MTYQFMRGIFLNQSQILGRAKWAAAQGPPQIQGLYNFMIFKLGYKKKNVLFIFKQFLIR